jgi:lysozyme
VALRFVVLDGCPCPKPMYPILRKLKKETGCTYNSLYRGDDVAGILHRNGKRTQRELFEQLPPGVANPPDRGSHILKGDGTVGRLFQKLPWWRLGIDINDWEVPAVIAAAKRHGWELYQPYPSGSEFHHLNFRKKPSRWRVFYRNVFGKKKAKAPSVNGKPAKVGVAGGVAAPAGPKKPKSPPVKPRPLGDGIDVSEHQGDVNWKQVKRKCNWAIVKATEGRTFTDSSFTAARLKVMKAAKLKVGAYHFARPDNNRPKNEVRHFVSTVQRAGGKFISLEAWREGKVGVLGVLDFEQAPFDQEWAAAWGAWFEKETGVKAVIYGGGYSLNPVLPALRRFAGVWLAAYVDDWRPYFDGPKDKVVFWQDTSSWKCPGVKGNVDHNRAL